MIEAAEADGRLKPGATLVEATAGNTGLGLALIAAQKGYALLLVIPDKMSLEKIQHLRALGAQIRITRSDVEKGHPEYYQDLAERLASEIPGAFYINQFGNPANPLAHEKGTGPEIWEQMEHKVDAVVCGVGSGGTLTGLSRFFRKHSPATEMVLADPAGSVLAEHILYGTTGVAGSWLVEGVGEDFIPPIADLSPVKKAYTIRDEESFATARALLLKEGILAGSSAGTLVSAALRYCRESKIPRRVVTLVPDSGNKYLSKMFNDYWLADQGLVRGGVYGDLRDLVSRPFEQGGVVSVQPGDHLATAFQRMRLHDYSQLPVIENGRVLGLIDEYDLMVAVSDDPANFKNPVSEHMTTEVVTLHSRQSVAELICLFRDGKVGVLLHDGRFFGVITRTDLLYSLRKQLK
jgi:cystathionine beta-synthase